VGSGHYRATSRRANRPITYVSGNDNTFCRWACFRSARRSSARLHGRRWPAFYTIQQMPGSNTALTTPPSTAPPPPAVFFSPAPTSSSAAAPNSASRRVLAFHMPVIKDKGLYDWSSINSVAPNFGRVWSNNTRWTSNITFSTRAGKCSPSKPAGPGRYQHLQPQHPRQFGGITCPAGGREPAPPRCKPIPTSCGRSSAPRADGQ